jgi:hypothetical protein
MSDARYTFPELRSRDWLHESRLSLLDSKCKANAIGQFMFAHNRDRCAQCHPSASGGAPDEMHRVSSVPPAVLAPLVNGAGTAKLLG